MLPQRLLACTAVRRRIVTPPPPAINIPRWKNTTEGIHLTALHDATWATGNMSYTELNSKFDLLWEGADGPTDEYPTNPPVGLSIIIGAYMAYMVDMQQPKKDITWWQANHPTWVIYEADGETPTNPFGDNRICLDVSNDEVVQWQINNFALPVCTEGYLGIMADEMTLTQQGSWPRVGHRDASDNFVALYPNGATTHTFKQDQINWCKTFRAKLRKLSKPMLLIPNFNPWFSGDGASWRDSGSWIKQLVANVDGIWHEQGFADYSSDTLPGADYMKNTLDFAVYCQSQNVFYNGNAYPAEAIQPPDSRRLYWMIASFMLCNEGLCALSTQYLNEAGNDHNIPYYNDWFSAAVGQPLAIGGGSAHYTSLYASTVFTRQYTSGFAALNADSSSHSITLPAGSWKDLNGNSISSPHTLAAQTAIVVVPA